MEVQQGPGTAPKTKEILIDQMEYNKPPLGGAEGAALLSSVWYGFPMFLLHFRALLDLHGPNREFYSRFQ